MGQKIVTMGGSMYVLTNKQLRHLKAMFAKAIKAYEYDIDFCLQRKDGGCKRCKAMAEVRDYAESLEPNS
jgi:hypothetical protein